MSKELKDIAQEAQIPAISMASTSSTSDWVESRATGVERNVTSPGEKRVPVGESTIFEAASLTKPVFAYVVLKMAERGEINLDQPLHEICSFGPPTELMRNHENYEKLTARMVLSHQAGLPNWFDRDNPESFDYLAVAGTRFDYSGEAYCFLREVVENISGKSLEDMAQDEFKKIGMRSSSFLPPKESEDKRQSLAVGHHADGTPDTNNHFYGINPAASLYTTAKDYTKFLKACSNDEYIRDNMFKSQVELADSVLEEVHAGDQKGIRAGVPDDTLKQISWGLGIGLQKSEDGSVTAFHWGDNETGRNFAALRLNQDGTSQAVTCLTNSTNGPLAFRQVCEPIVGDLSAVSQWLTLREHLPQPKLSEQAPTQPAPRAHALVSQFQSYIDSAKGVEHEQRNETQASHTDTPTSPRAPRARH